MMVVVSELGGDVEKAHQLIPFLFFPSGMDECGLQYCTIYLKVAKRVDLKCSY